MNAWMMHGNGRKLMNEFYANFNAVSFAGSNTGTQMGGWYRKEIKSPADFKGLKMRLGGGLVGEVMQKLGAVPQSIPGGEVYHRSKRHAGCGRMGGTLRRSEARLQQGCSLLLLPRLVGRRPEVDFFINDKALAGLSAENKAIIEAASAMANLGHAGQVRCPEPQCAQAAGGGQDQHVPPFPQSVLDASFKASMEVFAENDAKSPEWKKIYADMRNFQRDQVLWFRFAESRFDSFMSTRKL